MNFNMINITNETNSDWQTLNFGKVTLTMSQSI